MKNNYQFITKKHTKTFYYSTLFFPKNIKNDVFLLYSFVRIIDDLVDKKNPNKKTFYLYKNSLKEFLKNNKKSKIKIINDIGILIKKFNLKKEIFDYLKTQEKEITLKKYKTIKEFKNFIYGTAGTIGIMMAKILNLPKNSYQDAKSFGESLQIINNIRDIWEDYKRNRIYIPEELLKKYNLNHKNFLLKNNRKKFYLLIKYLIKKSFQLFEDSKKSFKFFNNNIFLPIKIAYEIYFYIAKKIKNNPELIFNKKKLKPNILIIFFIILKNFFLIYGFNKKN